jgi:hypothetical protein
MIAWDAMIEKATADLGPPETESKSFGAALRRSLERETGLAAQWITAREEACRFKPLRTTRSGRGSVLLRTSSEMTTRRWRSASTALISRSAAILI